MRVSAAGKSLALATARGWIAAVRLLIWDAQEVCLLLLGCLRLVYLLLFLAVLGGCIGKRIVPVAFTWRSIWSGYREETCLQGQHPPTLVLEGLLFVNELLVLPEQTGSVLLGEEVACLYQLAVIRLPFLEKGMIAFGSATCRNDDIGPRDVLVGS